MNHLDIRSKAHAESLVICEKMTIMERAESRMTLMIKFVVLQQ